MGFFNYPICQTTRSRGKFFRTPPLPTLNDQYKSSADPAVTATCCVPAKGGSELQNDKFFSGKNYYGTNNKQNCDTENNPSPDFWRTKYSQ